MKFTLSAIPAIALATFTFVCNAVAGPIAIYAAAAKEVGYSHEILADGTTAIHPIKLAFTSILVRDLGTGEESEVTYGVSGGKWYSVFLDTVGDYNTSEKYSYRTNGNVGTYYVFPYPLSRGRKGMIQYEEHLTPDYIFGLQGTYRLPKSGVSLTLAPKLVGSELDSLIWRDEEAPGVFEFFRTTSSKSLVLIARLSDLANLATPITQNDHTYTGGSIGRGVYEVVQTLIRGRYVLDTASAAD